MRLIDADELITAFPCGETVRTESVRATIKHMPTIEERKTGMWIRMSDADGEFYACSECGNWSGKPTNFCSECGSYNGGKKP